MDDADPTRLIDAQSAARLLRVSTATLYAYVSRGLIRSEARPGNGRARLYAAADVERLIWRKTNARKPAKAAATALNWGLPVLETQLSRIENGILTYRDRTIGALCRDGTLESTAALLWGAGASPFAGVHFDPAAVPGWAETARLLARDPVIDRAIALMALARRKDVPAGPFAEAARLVRALAAAVVPGPIDTDAPLHHAFAASWNRPAAAEVIRRVLICSADHELNTSTFAVRVVVSAHVDLATCILAGLAAFCGYEHTGLIADVRGLLAEAAHTDDPSVMVERALREHPALPGFFHRLYPDGDPRAAEILSALSLPPGTARLIEAVRRRAGLRPNIELALVIAEQACGLPQGAAEALFATGRSVGWIAHAMEQRASGIQIRPRAGPG